MPIPERILNARCPHEELYAECEDESCNDYLRQIEEGHVIDNSAEAWEESMLDDPLLDGMGEELRQLYGE